MLSSARRTTPRPASPAPQLANGGPSVAPDGAAYPLPSAEEVEIGFAEIAAAAEAHRARGGRVVAVQGLGFVGAAVSAAVASARDEAGRPLYYVIGIDLASPGAYWKVAKLSAGELSVVSPDEALARATREAVHEHRNLAATVSEAAYSLADVILVDVHLDVAEPSTDPERIAVDLEVFKRAIRAVGRQMRPDALVVVETTVPVGTCERVALPILEEERAARQIGEPVLLAHAYERVMPGPNYLDSIRAYWRTFAGATPEAAERTREFLATVVDTDSKPSWQLGDTTSSELAKLLENSYRAATIAFAHEWTLLAEQIGVNLFEVVDSIRVRKGTHDNMRYPGLGVGGYCLTKDSMLAQWGASDLLGASATLPVTLSALEINAAMPLHSVDLLRELAGGHLAGKEVAVCGVSYIADVADTRSSPTATVVDALRELGATVRVHDPWVAEWIERPDIPITGTITETLDGADAVLLAVPHAEYRELAADELTSLLGGPALIVDAQNILGDASAATLHAAGHRLLGVGKGHWRRLGYDRHVG